MQTCKKIWKKRIYTIPLHSKRCNVDRPLLPTSVTTHLMFQNWAPHRLFEHQSLNQFDALIGFATLVNSTLVDFIHFPKESFPVNLNVKGLSHLCLLCVTSIPSPSASVWYKQSGGKRIQMDRLFAPRLKLSQLSDRKSGKCNPFVIV